MATDEEKAAYREAYADWQRKLEELHGLVLDGHLAGKNPDQIKGVLNRESRAKQKYDEARRRLLGIEA
jgi:hypothetical protein